MGDHADDLLSETFLTAFRKRAAYQPSRIDVRPWLYGIAGNLVRRHKRAELTRYRLLARSAAAESANGAADDLDAALGRVDAQLVSARLAAVWQANAHDKDCPTTLDYNGVSYAVYHVTEEIGEDDLGVGTERGCGYKGPWSKDVAVSRIAGVDPRTALVTPVAADVLYVAEGVTIDELPSDVAELVAP